MPPRRLPAASTSEVERARVPFTFDGRRYEGVWGEPVAVSLLAVGRRTLSRSFRFHRPRGLMCSTGQCGWCECEVDGRPSVRTCRVPLRDGMVVRGEHAWPSVEHDVLRVVDLGSRFVPPGFYHHRFLWPRRLRKAYLDVIRSFGGRGRLGDVAGTSSARGPRTVRRDDPDVLVVGGGHGGLSAAVAAAEAGGGTRVVVLEADPSVDGAAGLLDEARSRGVEVRAGSVATGWYRGMVTAMDDETIWELQPGVVVAATGSYELVPMVPGSDRPGVLSARLALQLLARHGVLPGERALLVGSGEELDAAGAALRDAGANVVGPVPTDALRSIGGRGPVAWARFVEGNGASAGRGEAGRAAAGRGAVAGRGGAVRRERVDLVIFGDRTSNLDLVLAAGGRVGWRDGRLAPDVDDDGETSVPGLFVAGDAAGLSGDAVAMVAQARRTGAAAARYVRAATAERAAAGGPTTGASPKSVASSSPTSTRGGDTPRSTTVGRPPGTGSAQAVLCFCEDVRGWEVRAELAAGYADPELVKRRTGALTGPCQGKYCLSAVACAMDDGEYAEVPEADLLSTPVDVHLPTGRPPLRPIRLCDLIASGPEADVGRAPSDAGRAPSDAGPAPTGAPHR